MKLNPLNYTTIKFHDSCVLFGGESHRTISKLNNKNVSVFIAEGGFVFKKLDNKTKSVVCTFTPYTSVQSITWDEDAQVLEAANRDA